MIPLTTRRISTQCVRIWYTGVGLARIHSCGLTESYRTRTLSSVPISAEAKEPQNLPCWTVRCATAEDLERVGKHLAAVCGAGDVLMLRGDLGAGKTTLVRGFLRQKLQEPELRVTSPSYLLDNIYECRDNGSDSDLTIHHLDLYRLPTGCDMTMLGIPAIFSSSLCLVEWPQRLPAGAIPRVYLDVELLIDSSSRPDTSDLAAGAAESRTIRITPSAAESKWSSMLHSVLGEMKCLM